MNTCKYCGMEFTEDCTGEKLLKHTPTECTQQQIKVAIETLRREIAGLKFPGPEKTDLPAIREVLAPTGFKECEVCAAKPGTPTLCPSCVQNRAAIDRLARANSMLTGACNSMAREKLEASDRAEKAEQDLATEKARITALNDIHNKMVESWQKERDAANKSANDANERNLILERERNEARFTSDSHKAERAKLARDLAVLADADGGQVTTMIAAAVEQKIRAVTTKAETAERTVATLKADLAKEIELRATDRTDLRAHETFEKAFDEWKCKDDRTSGESIFSGDLWQKLKVAWEAIHQTRTTCSCAVFPKAGEDHDPDCPCGTPAARSRIGWVDTNKFSCPTSELTLRNTKPVCDPRYAWTWTRVRVTEEAESTETRTPCDIAVGCILAKGHKGPCRVSPTMRATCEAEAAKSCETCDWRYAGVCTKLARRGLTATCCDEWTERKPIPPPADPGCNDPACGCHGTLPISVQPLWMTRLPLQQQSVLFLASRGADGTPKDHPCKAVQVAYRATVLVAARYGRLLAWGEKADSFMSLHEFSDDAAWGLTVKAFFQNYDSLPMHFTMHLAHGVEILGYKHPDKRFRDRWHALYLQLVSSFHLQPESELQMDARLADWGRKHWDGAST